MPAIRAGEERLDNALVEIEEIRHYFRDLWNIRAAVGRRIADEVCWRLSIVEDAIRTKRVHAPGAGGPRK